MLDQAGCCQPCVKHVTGGLLSAADYNEAGFGRAWNWYPYAVCLSHGLSSLETAVRQVAMTSWTGPRVLKLLWSSRAYKLLCTGNLSRAGLMQPSLLLCAASHGKRKCCGRLAPMVYTPARPGVLYNATVLCSAFCRKQLVL